MRDPIFRSWLERQYQEAMALAKSSDLLELQPVEGHPPFRYLAAMRCRGLLKTAGGDIHEGNLWVTGIWFQENYLRGPIHAAHVLTYLGPALEPWHPNIRPPFICMQVTAGISLVDLLYALFELYSWNLFGTGDDGLNPAAAQWARNQDPARFPIDRRPLKRVGRASSMKSHTP